jgi:hypothetical protein
MAKKLAGEQRLDTKLTTAIRLRVGLLQWLVLKTNDRSTVIETIDLRRTNEKIAITKEQALKKEGAGSRLLFTEHRQLITARL